MIVYVVVAPPGALRAQTAELLACAAEKPVVRPGETLRLSAFPSAGLRGASLTWHASNGASLTPPRGVRTIRWRAPDSAARAETIRVEAASSARLIASCSVIVIVSDLVSRGSLDAGFALVGRDRPIPDAFGLYTLLLLRNPPQKGDERGIQLAERVISEALRQSEDASTLLGLHVSRSEINLLVLPVLSAKRARVSALINERDYDAAAKATIEGYDFAFAWALARRFGAPAGDRPMLVGTAACDAACTGPRITYQFDYIPARLAGKLVGDYFDLCGQDRTPASSRARVFIARMAGVLNGLGEALDVSVDAVNSVMEVKARLAGGTEAR